MIRIANIEDSSRMAEIHVFGWRCAYKDFIPLDYLYNKFTVKVREEKFREYFSIKHDNEEIYVYEHQNIVKAFLTIGNFRDDDDKDKKIFELMAIYVHPLFQRQKIGTKLVEFCIKEAISKNKEELVLWVFEKNKESIKFYEKMGFKKDGKKKLMEFFNEYAIRMSKKL